MTYLASYAADAPERTAVDTLPGLTLLEFGVDWCPHCQGAQPFIREAFAARADITHIKVEDGPGRRLGRSYRVKLWPSLILLRDGVEIARVVRPTSLADLQALADGQA